MTAGRSYSAARRPVFLAGAPGAGKSTAARLAADRLGVGTADLDELVRASTGSTPAHLIETQGEAAFRAHELRALRALDGEPKVVALGGGTLTRGEAREEVRRRGVVVGLEVDPAALSQRLRAARPGDDAQRRPLLSDSSVGAISALLAQRRLAYATVDRRVDGMIGVDLVAEAIAEALRDLHIVDAAVGGQRSRVLVGRGLEQSLVGAVAHLEPRRPIVVVLDRGVPAEVRERWVAPLGQVHEVIRIEGPGGEAMKTWTMLGDALDRATKAGAGRQSVVVGLGGGATCDVAGMTAALLGRGAPLVLVPSSLLAQVDASVGGKAAVNTAAGRNLAGAFHAATDVIVDLALLATLPEAERRSGLAELVKIAALFDAALFDRVTGGDDLDPRTIARAIELKADVVAQDPFERHERKLLNFGHTLAHGIEAASAYAWRHGDAVAVGMAAMARWAVAEGWMDRESHDRLLGGLSALGLPTGAPHELLTRAVGFLSHDKKAAGEKITVVTLNALAQPNLREVGLARVEEAMIQHGGER